MLVPLVVSLALPQVSATDALVVERNVPLGNDLSSRPTDFVSDGQRVLFPAIGDTGRELWVTDGPSDGTTGGTQLALEPAEFFHPNDARLTDVLSVVPGN